MLNPSNVRNHHISREERPTCPFFCPSHLSTMTSVSSSMHDFCLPSSAPVGDTKKMKIRASTP